jgi:hypothetical protein
VGIDEALQPGPLDELLFVVLPAGAVNEIVVEGPVFVRMLQVQSVGFDSPGGADPWNPRTTRKPGLAAPFAFVQFDYFFRVYPVRIRVRNVVALVQSAGDNRRSFGLDSISSCHLPNQIAARPLRGSCKTTYWDTPQKKRKGDGQA